MHIDRYRAVLAFGLMVAAGTAHGVDMYRWVDERGITNVADAVPEKYRKTAVRLDSAQFNVSESQQQEAAARAEALASAAAAKPVPQGPESTRRLARPGPVSRPAPSAAGGDCASLQRRYQAAQDCFEGGSRNQNGSINANKSPQCPLVVDPSPRCGVPAASSQ